MRTRAFERGMALTSALLLLLVTTLLGIAMFRSFGFLEAVAGNTREKQRATHAAEAAQNYAEWSMTANGAIQALATPVSCSGSVTDLTQIPICSNVIANPAVIPWTTYVAYTPPGMSTGSAGTLGNYVVPPQFYISFLSSAYDRTSGAQTSSYQIDALGYGGTTNSAAVVESGYTVSILYNSNASRRKFINLGMP
jgi:Tfp pilus assembly protein PilX